MLLQFRKHDGVTEEIEVLRSGFACEIVSAFDWDAERRRFEQLAESEGESYLPSIAFTDDARCFCPGPECGAPSGWIAGRRS